MRIKEIEGRNVYLCTSSNHPIIGKVIHVGSNWITIDVFPDTETSDNEKVYIIPVGSVAYIKLTDNKTPQ